MSGTLKPISIVKAAVELAEPSHNCQPEGAVAVGHIIIVPVGTSPITGSAPPIACVEA
jgi:hypothetical protein